ncbi:MAG: thioredoxin family protein [Elusimicrobiota bacterium]
MKNITIVGVLAAGLLLVSAINSNAVEKVSAVKSAQPQKKSDIKVTFVELGSVNCMPCKAMQPVMKEIEEEYSKQVKVVFYDVWTEEGRQYGEKYKIRVIPTQVFLDKAGKEYFRHEGFFPKEEIVKVLKQQGVSETAKSAPKKKESGMKMEPGQVCE